MYRKRDAYTEAHDRYYLLVFSTVRIKVADRSDVEDICQNIFLKFYEKFEEIEADRHRLWLYGAMRIFVLEYYRKKNKHVISEEEIFSDISLTFVNGFRDARMVIAETIDDEGVFGSEDDRVLFDLIALYNYSYAEVGRQMGYSKRQVGYRYRIIVERIIAGLKKRGIGKLEDLL
jgi:RNA polymerase sigma factor (sigma-70 family)